MAKDLVHAGTRSWWSTRRGLVIRKPQRKWFASKPTSPRCVAALAHDKK